MAEEKTYSQMRKEFQENFFKKIVPKLKKQDNKRKMKLFLAIVCSAPFIILEILLIYATILSYPIDDEKLKDTVQSFIYLLAIAFGIFYSIKKNFENTIKEQIMPIICSCFPSLEWASSKYLGSTSVFTNSYVIPKYSDKDIDDVFKGKFKDVNFDIVEIECSRGSGKKRTTVFDGVVIKLDMNKDFSCHTVIKANSKMHLSPSSTLIHTTLEDIQFEKKFDVFTDDEVEARYLITPSFMERLNNMKIAFKANKISCAFYRNNLLIALHTSKDLFSICSLFKPIDDPKQFFTMYEEIVSIIKLIDYFKLDQRIGL